MNFLIINQTVRAVSFDNTTITNIETIQSKNNQHRFTKKFVKKRLKKKCKSITKTINDFEFDAIWLAILALIISIGAFVFVLLATLSTAGIGLVILYYILSLLFGAGGIWIGIIAWKESKYSTNKSQTRWITFFALLFSAMIVGTLLQPFDFLF